MKRACVISKAIFAFALTAVVQEPAVAIPPGCTLFCPPGVTQGNDPGQCGAIVSYPGPFISGTCGVVTCSPPSGTFFPVGPTLVTCMASAGGSCGFSVNVIDTQPPMISCPSNIVRSTDPGQCAAMVTFAPTMTDNCPGGTVFCNPPSGSSFSKG